MYRAKLVILFNIPASLVGSFGLSSGSDAQFTIDGRASGPVPSRSALFRNRILVREMSLGVQLIDSTEYSRIVSGHGAFRPPRSSNCLEPEQKRRARLFSQKVLERWPNSNMAAPDKRVEKVERIGTLYLSLQFQWVSLWKTSAGRHCGRKCAIPLHLDLEICEV
jgi:hypothetical protein